MKTPIILLSSVLLSFTAFIWNNNSNTESKKVEHAVASLFDSMMKADKASLVTLLSDDLSYGHSSGIIQNKAEFVEEIMSGKPVKLTEIKAENQTITVSGNVALVRHIFTAKGINAAGEVNPVRIGNCLVWKKEKGSWKLFVRQAYRL
jgi:ketosteroid isomerase-like protein